MVTIPRSVQEAPAELAFSLTSRMESESEAGAGPAASSSAMVSETTPTDRLAGRTGLGRAKVLMHDILEKQQLATPNRRDGRVVEGARLESVYRGNSIEGSNPSLSARIESTNYGSFGQSFPEFSLR